MRTLRTWWSRVIGFLRPGTADQDFADELQSHIDLHIDDNIRAGMTPTEARRLALAKLGSAAAAKEAHRDRRGLPGLSTVALDLKLGARMLVKYPGLTVIGGFAMAFAICVGTVIFQMLSIVVYPSLPLSQGDRLVRLRSWNTEVMATEQRLLYDFNIWRSYLRSIPTLGAWRDVSNNLIVTPGDVRTVQVAEISPVGFQVSDATPLMGRVLTDADVRADAPAVAVISHHVWQSRFGGDPAVLGRTVQLGSTFVTVIGVMNEGYAFPVAHDVWTPLRLTNTEHAPRSGPAISVFGLLAADATVDTAQAELTTVAQRMATELPDTHASLQARVAPYAMPDVGPGPDDMGIFASIYFFAVAFVVLICSNVALLLFARAATRETELIVRTALGASRTRIIGQMFIEALVLGGASAVLGLVAAHVVLQNWGLTFLEVNLGRLPFWYDVSIEPATVLFALGLTMLGSAVAGVTPALKVTRGMGSQLKQTSAGAGGLQFGGIWTVVIVVQVAITVAFPAVVYLEQWQLRHIQTFEAGFPTEQYLGARLQLDMPLAQGEVTDAQRDAHRATWASRLEEMRRRVTEEPGVVGVTFVDRLPRTARPERYVELAGAGASEPQPEATLARIDPSYFAALETSVTAGRPFTQADLAPGSQAVIVDQSFVDLVLQGRNPIGQQLRFASDDPAAPKNPWMEVVGVVKDLGMGTPTRAGRAAGLYLPAAPEGMTRTYMLVHTRTDPLTMAPRLGELATAIDPALRVSEVQRLDTVLDSLIWFVGLWLRVSLVMTTVALVLSLSGIYSVLSFVVARRQREIGVRLALGADRRRVITAIFRRPVMQVGLGVSVGSALIMFAGNVGTEMPGFSGNLSFGQFAMIAGYGLVMFAVCLLACIAPTKRALSVEPTAVLRMD